MSTATKSEKKSAAKPAAKKPTKGAPPPALAMVKLTQIELGKHNPRAVIDPKGLTASVREHGVLQPIIVAPAEKGKHKLVAGHRRYAAAKAAKLSEIPALIKGATDDLITATIENVEREDLNNVELAAVCEELAGRGMTQPQIGTAIGRSERWVRNVMQVLKVPEAALPAFASGTVPLEAAGKVAKIAEASPRAAEVLVDQVAGEKAEYDPAWLNEDEGIARILEEATPDSDPYRRQHKDKKPQLAEVLFPIGGNSRVDHERYFTRGWHPNELPIDTKAKKEIADGLKIGKVKVFGYWEARRLCFETQADVDAAKAYGCLLEVPHNGRGTKVTDYYATDMEWVADRARLKVEEHKKQKVKQDKALAKEEHQKTARNTGAEDDLSPEELKAHEEKVKVERKRERAKEAKKRAERHDANIALGHNLYKKLSAPKINADIARLLAILAVEHRGGSQFSLGKLAARGLTWIREDLHEVVENKAGELTKVTPVGSASEALTKEFEDAKTPEKLAGAVVRALISAQFASEEVAVQSNRTYFAMPGEYGGGLAAEIPDLIDKIASDASVLPEVMAKEAEKRARGRS